MWLILGSSAAFSCNDACLKALGAEQPIFEAIMWRGCAVTAVLVGCAWRQGHLHDGIERRDAMLIGLIAGAEVITLFSFLYALLRLPLGQVIAIQQSLRWCNGRWQSAFWVRDSSAGEHVGWDWRSAE